MGDLDFLNLNPATDAAPSSEPIPDGVYECAIADVQLKNTKDFTGKYLSLELQVLSGEHMKRRVWDMITVKNPNDKAVLIGRATLAALCNAVGLPELKDSQQLAGKVVKAKIATKPAEGQYDAKNVVKKYLPAVEGAIPAPSAQQQTVAKAQADSGRPPF